MNTKTLLRTFLFLLLLFVVIYVGKENTHSIDFRFPLVLGRPVRASAAVIFFAVFAIGVLGGTLLHAGGGNSNNRENGPRKR